MLINPDSGFHKLRISDIGAVEEFWKFRILIVRRYTISARHVCELFLDITNLATQMSIHARPSQFIRCGYVPQKVMFVHLVVFQHMCLQWPELVIMLFLFDLRILDISLDRAALSRRVPNGMHKHWLDAGLTFFRIGKDVRIGLTFCLISLSISGRVGIPHDRHPNWRRTSTSLTVESRQIQYYQERQHIMSTRAATTHHSASCGSRISRRSTEWNRQK